MQLMKSTAVSGRATPRCSEVLVSHGEPVLRLERLNETHVGLLHNLGSLDLDVAMMHFSPARMKMRIRPAAPAQMPSPFIEQKLPNLFPVIHRVSRSSFRSSFAVSAVGFQAAPQGSMICHQIARYRTT